MVVVWTGMGIVVLPVGFAPLLIMELVIDQSFGSGYYSTHGWTILVATLLSGAALWATGTWFENLRARASRIVRDEKTGQSILPKTRDAFFFIPIKYWAFVPVALGLVTFLRTP